MILDSERQRTVLVELLTDPTLAERAMRLIAQGHPVGDEYIDLLKSVRDAGLPKPKRERGAAA